jgi:hypothetical protein
MSDGAKMEKKVKRKVGRRPGVVYREPHTHTHTHAQKNKNKIKTTKILVKGQVTTSLVNSRSRDFDLIDTVSSLVSELRDIAACNFPLFLSPVLFLLMKWSHHLGIFSRHLCT